MKQLIFALCLLVHCSAHLQGKAIEVESTVSAVTVYIQNAQVERSKKVQIPAGRSLVVFKNLSPFIDPQSIQVKTKGNAMVMSVRAEKDYSEFLKEKPEETHAATIVQINEQLKLIRTQIEIIDDEISYLNTNKSIGSTTSGVNVNDLKQSVQFYQERISTLKLKKLQLNTEISELTTRLEQIKNVQTKSTTVRKFPKGEIWIEVEANVAASLEFLLNYVVSNAGWFPQYDIRVKDITQPLALYYKAQVYQNTQEDWNNVKLKFSTANPNVSGKMMTIRPYYLNYKSAAPTYRTEAATDGGIVRDSRDREPLIGASVMVKGTTIGTTTDIDGKYQLTLPQGQVVLVFSYLGYKRKEITVNGNLPSVDLEEEEMLLQETVVAASRIQNVPKQKITNTVNEDKFASKPLATTETALPTVAEFELEQPFSIPSDGKNYLLNIKQTDVPARYIYYSTPKVDKAAYLTAGVGNWEQLQLLAGEASIFFEDTYIGKTLINTTNAEDTLIFSLGKDNNVLIYRDIQRQNTGKKILSTKKEETRAWTISVKNNKLQEIQLVLIDQVPVSTMDEIEVITEEKSVGQQDAATGIITWTLSIPSAQKKEVTLRYLVKYPKGKVLTVE
jgi:hypothetical protein